MLLVTLLVGVTHMTSAFQYGDSSRLVKSHHPWKLQHKDGNILVAKTTYTSKEVSGWNYGRHSDKNSGSTKTRKGHLTDKGDSSSRNDAWGNRFPVFKGDTYKKEDVSWKSRNTETESKSSAVDKRSKDHGNKRGWFWNTSGRSDKSDSNKDRYWKSGDSNSRKSKTRGTKGRASEEDHSKTRSNFLEENYWKSENSKSRKSHERDTKETESEEDHSKSTSHENRYWKVGDSNSRENKARDTKGTDSEDSKSKSRSISYDHGSNVKTSKWRGYGSYDDERQSRYMGNLNNNDYISKAGGKSDKSETKTTRSKGKINKSRGSDHLQRHTPNDSQNSDSKPFLIYGNNPNVPIYKRGNNKELLKLPASYDDIEVTGNGPVDIEEQSSSSRDENEDSSRKGDDENASTDYYNRVGYGNIPPWNKNNLNNNVNNPPLKGNIQPWSNIKNRPGNYANGQPWTDRNANSLPENNDIIHVGSYPSENNAKENKPTRVNPPMGDVPINVPSESTLGDNPPMNNLQDDGPSESKPQEIIPIQSEPKDKIVSESKPNESSPTKSIPLENILPEGSSTGTNPKDNGAQRTNGPQGNNESKDRETEKLKEPLHDPQRFGSVMKPPFGKGVDINQCSASAPTCCVPGELKINLGSQRNVKAKEGRLDGVTVSVTNARGRNKKRTCSATALVKVDFEKLDTDGCFGCVEAPYCGRRMLKLDLDLSYAKRKGWLFNVGDSQSNDGFRGDSGHQQNNAELQGLYPNITVYPRDYSTCGSIDNFTHIVDAVDDVTNHVTIYASNNYVRVTNEDGLDFKLCHRCLFALNGQRDAGTKGENERVFIGLNRVIRNLSRTGYGVCSATLSWMCPWCDA